MKMQPSFSIPLSQEALSSSQEETGRLRQIEEEQVCALRAVEEEGRRREAQGAKERARMVGMACSVDRP